MRSAIQKHHDDVWGERGPVQHDAEASAAWDAMKLCQTGSSAWKKALGKFEYHAERARHIRVKLRRGERESAF